MTRTKMYPQTPAADTVSKAVRNIRSNGEVIGVTKVNVRSFVISTIERRWGMVSVFDHTCDMLTGRLIRSRMVEQNRAAE
jgi:hypothetical protein